MDSPTTTSAPARPARDRPGRPATAAAVVALLALHLGLAESSLVRENPTIDEVAHLPAGVTYWQAGTFRLYHLNPPLVKLVAAAPVVLDGPETAPIYRSAAWNASEPSPIGVAHHFAALNAGRYFELFTRARRLMPLFSALGALVVFAWSARLYGRAGGLLSLALWCLCPNVLAHARLVTTDVGAAALGVGATYLFWRHLRRPSWPRAALAGAALGAAQLTKFSLLLLYALWPLIALADLALQAPRDGLARRLARTAGQAVVLVAVSVVVIDLGYGFEGVGRPLGSFDFACGSLTRPGVSPRRSPNPIYDLAWRHRVNRVRGTWLGALPSPLPAHYLLGLDELKLDAEGLPRAWVPSGASDPTGTTGFPAYLDGELRWRGWVSYYPKTLLYKLPEGTWALLLAAAVATVASRRGRPSRADELAVGVVPAATLLAAMSTTRLNFGLRYILPAFPYVFILAGRLAPWAAGLSGRVRTAAIGGIVAALLATTAATASIHPHYLAYFNALSGGPARGSEHLIDSNLDWGQDLVNLRDWLRSRPHEGPVGLAYFGQIHPGLLQVRGEGFDWFLPPCRPGALAPMAPAANLEGPREELTPGLYAVSASILRGMPWTHYAPGDPLADPKILRGPAWQAGAHAYSYFRELTPIDTIGHSILIYRLSQEEARRLSRRLLDAPEVGPGS